MAITAACNHRDGTGTTISGRAPLGVVLDAGSVTTSTHTYTALDGGVGIRFDENMWTGVTYTKATNRLSKTGLATLFNWEKISLGTLPAITSGNWTLSDAVLGDTLALWHNGTGLHGKPKAVKLNSVVVPEGTVGSLTNEQWGWGTINGENGGSNTLYVQSALSTPTVEVIYGDGTHLRLSSATGSVSIGWFEVKDKIDQDTIDLQTTFYSGGSATLSDVVINQNVSPGTDLEYIWSCTANTVEEITHTDDRPGAASTLIDYHKGYGQIWAFVFKEGFGTSTITLTVNDLTNGETATRSIVVTETAWPVETSSNTFYIDSVGGSESNDGSTALLAKAKWETGIEWLRNTATTPAILYVAKGSAFTLAANATQWTNKTGDRKIKAYGSGATPTIACAGFSPLRQVTTANADLRISDLTITAARDTPVFKKSVLIRVSSTGASGQNAFFPDANSGLDSSDSVIWDCTGVASGAAYAVFAGGSATAAQTIRRAIIGCTLSNTGSESTVRCYSQKSVWAYNKLTSGGGSTKDCLRIAAGNLIVSDHNHVFSNYISLGASDSQAIDLFVDAGAQLHNHVTISQNYIRNLGSGSSIRNAIQLHITNDVRITNNIMENFARNVVSGTSSQTGLRIYHNTVYNSTVGDIFFGHGGTGGTGTSFADVKAINNIFSATGSSTSARFFLSDGAFDARLITKLHKCLIQMLSGVSGGTIRISADNDTVADWEAFSVGSDLIGGTGVSAVDPLFVNSGGMVFTLQGGSPCIGTGYILASVPRDFRGYVPSGGTFRDDIGALQLNGVSPSTGGGSSPGMGSLAARFRCVGLRRK